ncbi:hypothetical protein KVV02_002639 [Mortierella alpina]|uniref:protein kinase C n=1 Tax=Mortierella alpina TaxID=64518 RepID=A0A9P8CY99_MORAP|nr:hypothetical protein KVV02_002639 [Mortierella alpina]
MDYDKKSMEMDDEQKLEDVRKRLQKEKEIKAATMKLRDFQQSEAAKAACDATMEESQQRINYFQNEFDKLQLKKQESSPKVPRTQIAITLPSMENAPPMMKAGFDNQGRSYPGQSPDMRMTPSRKASDSSSHYPDDFISHRPLSTVAWVYAAGLCGFLTTRFAAGQQDNFRHPLTSRRRSVLLRYRFVYHPLDLLKAPTPITSKKVTYKLRELAYKLDIEKKVKLASERLEQLGMSAKEGNAESSERVVLLRRALQKYQGLYIPGQAEDDTTSPPGTALRRPMTGTLYVRVGGIKHQNNAPMRNARPPESMAYIKIDGTPRAKTRMARNGPGGIRWNEDFEVPVTKASEIEIAVFDKPDSVPVPIGLFWLKISDLVEELRRKKVEADNDAAWVAANVQDLVARTPTVRPGTGPLGDNPINGVEGIESWWDLEPIGQISLKFNFVRDVAVRKRPSGLGRQGAVRKRKDEVREIQGHKFVSQKFFQIMCCALCAELFTGKAAQCEDCKFTCHQKCADKVFIKCISSKTVEDPDEAKLNHRIPHRFETFTNLSPTWCSHCGHMLTFGRRHRKCTECPAVAHEGCSDLVPNHCGMPAETANKLIEELPPHMPTLKIVNKQPPKPTRKYGLNDFHFLAVLGKGNFGKVMLAEDKKGGELFAIKVLKKESIVKQDETESARSEKRIYQVANKERHPFLTTLHSCFQTDTRLYFVMEYVRGGDLMMHIQKDKRFGEHRAKFYGCQVLLALQYFHQNNIVYRDLKLDNILLTVDGHIKIADYGLCKENMPFGATTRTICGTPEFMAPEILEEQPYDRAVDWWAFGVLMYEMLLGRAPFSGEEEDDIYDSILEDEPLYPHGFGRHEQALLQSLLVKVPSLRLGSGPSDADEIKAHAYFRNVNFDDVYHKRIRPPFLPKVSSATDVSNFDSEFTSEAPGETPTDYRLDRVEQDLFKGFSYVSPWAQP